VEFLYGNYTLSSTYLRLKVHIANPDSNLVVLNHAYEYWQPIVHSMIMLWSRKIKSRSTGFSICWDFVIQALWGLERWFNGYSNSQSPICAAEGFLPLHKFMGVELVWKIEMGLKRGQWLSRKWRNTVHMQQLSTCHCNYQFSQQLLTIFDQNSSLSILHWHINQSIIQGSKPF
jgi:hypothetical protein